MDAGLTQTHSHYIIIYNLTIDPILFIECQKRKEKKNANIFKKTFQLGYVFIQKTFSRASQIKVYIFFPLGFPGLALSLNVCRSRSRTVLSERVYRKFFITVKKRSASNADIQKMKTALRSNQRKSFTSKQHCFLTQEIPLKFRRG